MRRAALAAIACLALALVAMSCGGGDEEQTTTQDSETAVPKGQTDSQPQGDEGSTTTTIPTPAGAEELSPKAAAYYAKQLRQSFPKPKPAPGAKELSAKAIAEGEQACEGATPTEIAERFEGEAELDPDQEELLAELPRYEEEAVRDPSYVAGQVAAMVYEATLPDRSADYGFQGCVFVLARGLGEGLGEVG